VASLSQLMFQEASRTISETGGGIGDPAKALAMGAEIAQRREAMEQQRAQIEQAKLGAKGKAVEGVLKVIGTAQKFKSEADQRRFIKGALPGAIQAYGVDDVFTPEMQDMLINSGDARKAVSIIESQVKQGNMSLQEGLGMLTMSGLGDAVEMASLQEAEKFALSERGKTSRTEMLSRAQDIRQQTQIGAQQQAAQTAFQQTGAKKVAQTAATDFTLYQKEKAGLGLNLKNLEAAAKRLENMEVTTGDITTKIPGLSSAAVQSIINQESRNVENDARAAIMPLLRATLGSAFTEGEGERIFATVFDPKAPSMENARRIKNKIEELRETIKNKEGLFIEQGFMSPSEAKGTSEPKRKSENPATSGETFIDDNQVNVLRPVYKQLIAGGKSPEEIFTMLKSSSAFQGATDAQLNAVLKKFQIEGK